MSNEEELTTAQRELEGALAALRPARGRLSRDEVMFRAGWASARRESRRRGAALAAATIVLGAAAAVLAFRPPATLFVERVVYRPAPDAPAVAPAPWEPIQVPGAAGGLGRTAAPRGDYLRLREEVLEKGVDALPQSPGPVAQDDLHDLQGLLRGRPAGPPEPPSAGSLMRRWHLNGDRS